MTKFHFKKKGVFVYLKTLSNFFLNYVRVGVAIM